MKESTSLYQYKLDTSATSINYPEWLLVFSEFLTIVVCIWIVLESMRIVKFFYKNPDKMAKLLTWNFFTDTLTYFVTLAMGLSLFFNEIEAVKSLVIIRPWVLVLNGIALRKLVNHFYNYKD